MATPGVAPAESYSHIVVATLSATAATSADKIHEAYASLLSQHAEGYIWQVERMELETVSDGSVADDRQVILRGQMDAGDCLEDEWFTTFMMLELTRHFEDLVVQLGDSDGDFLLIEAADHLPSWITPENSQNRTFLHRGKVHIIPLPRTPAEIALLPSGAVSLERAIQIVRSPQLQTEASEPVQQAILKRTACYPQKAHENSHFARCLIPHRVAHILHHNPQLVSAAVSAFYTRTPQLLKACNLMTEFPPSSNVMSTVQFSRMLYAQMLGQQLFPPRPFRLPPSDSPDFAAAELGMKLTCGMEMLLKADLQRSSGLKEYPFDGDAQWQRYHHSLEKSGYYRGEMVGSALYRKLDTVAKADFLAMKQTKGEHGPSAAQQVRSLLQVPLVPVSDLSQRPSSSDDWLYVTEEEMDARMHAHTAPDASSVSRATHAGSDVDLQQVGENIKSFMEQMSGIDGAEFPGSANLFENEHSDDENDESDGGESSIDGESVDAYVPRPGNDNNLQFNPDSFVKTLQHLTTDKGQDNDPSMDHMMAAMDAELAQTKLYDGFEQQVSSNTAQSGGPGIDIDLNLVKNILESFSSQHGLAGPASNMLGRMGIKLPANDDNTEGDRRSATAASKKTVD
ncbi:hypothetical protein RI367_008167 [Sorochytrium milnesiophthora]